MSFFLFHVDDMGDVFARLCKACSEHFKQSVGELRSKFDDGAIIKD